MDGWRITRHPDVERAVVMAGGDQLWEPYRGSWGRLRGTWWLATTFVVSSAQSGQPLRLRLAMHSDYPVYHGRVPWAVGLSMHFEGLLYVNGKAFHGLDPNRSEVLLTDAVVPGTVYDLLIEAYTTAAIPKFFEAAVLDRDQAVCDLHWDVQAVQRLIPAFAGDPIAAQLQAILSEAHGQLTQDSAWRSRIPTERATIANGLQAIRGPLSQVTINLVGHCHIDTVWLWRLAETRRKAGRTLSTQARYLEEFPEYTFLQSAPVLYELCREDYPELFAQIVALTAQGRFCPEGAMYVEADCNLTGGESLVRQILYGTRFFRATFGIESRILWLPDVFGYTGALPQILRQFGIECFVTTKLATLGGKPQPDATFRWRGIDGSTVLGHFPKSYINWADAPRFADWARTSRASGQLPLWLMPFGFGDGGGGVTKDDLELVRRWRALPFFPRLEFTTPAVFLDTYSAAAASASPQQVPERCGELYYEAHRGTYTTVAAIKWANRRGEQALLSAETWVSLAALHGQGPQPRRALERAWKQVLLNQFHDTLPGSAIAAVYADALVEAEQALASCAGISRDAVAQLVGGGDHPMVSNSFGHAVSGLVEVPVETAGQATQRLSDPDGIAVRRLAWVGPVPPFSVVPLAPVIADPDAFTWDGERLTTPFWIAEFRSTASRGAADLGVIWRLFDRRAGREVFTGPGNRLATFVDQPQSCEAWEIERDFAQKPIAIFSTVKQEVIATGPLLFVVRTTWQGERSKLIQDIRFSAHSPRIDFVTWVDWHERRVLLKVAFPLHTEVNVSRAETAFGWVERPMHRATDIAREQFETPMHRWLDVGDEVTGISLLNDGKYGYDGLDGVIRLTLLKSSGYAELQPAHGRLDPLATIPDPAEWADQGIHRFTYALWPRTGGLAEGGTLREAAVLNRPLTLVFGQQPFASGVSSNAANVIIETIKPAEDGHGWIVRLYEAAGRATSATITLGNARAVARCDLREVTLESLPDLATVTLSVGAFAIVSLRVVAENHGDCDGHIRS